MQPVHILHVRDSARARAVEDFEFFCNNVLNLCFAKTFCDDVQRRVESGEIVVLEPSRQRALDAWFRVRGLNDTPLSVKTDTLKWLFAEVAA